MKLTSVELHSASEVTIFSFRDPTSLNPYNIKDIEGLASDSIVPSFYETGVSPKFYNLFLQKRQIVINAGLNPNFATEESYSDLRDAIYRLIATSRLGKVQLYFNNNTDIIATVAGSISKVETDQFERTQEIKITILCDEPMLTAPSRTDIDLSGLDLYSITVQDDLSTAPHGFIGDVLITVDTPLFILVDPNDSGTWSFSIEYDFLVGDILHFSSEFNNKELYIARGAAIIYLADTVPLDAIWPLIFPGTNDFQIIPAADLVWNSVSYYPTYWGV